jgi:succinoglycan biosynthesis transport protein ExoP
MDEVYKFFTLVRRYRLSLIIIPIITIIITFFLVRNLANSYISQAQIATGIVDESQQQSLLIQTVTNRDQVAQKFSNLVEIMRMNRVLNQVGYRLILHDLTSPQRFKKESKDLSELNIGARRHAIEVYTEKYNKAEALTLSNPDQNGLNRVLVSMGYDPDALRNKLNIFRSGESDYIVVQFESESPELSAYVVNQVSDEFMKSYSTALKSRKIRENDFLKNLLKEKTDSLSNRMSRLRNYKVSNGVINLPEQSKQLYNLVLEYDTKKQEAIEKTSSYAGALNEIDRKFDPKEREYIEAKLSKVNQSIVNTKAELSSLYNLYINNDLEQRYKDSYDSLSNKLTEQINKSADQYITNPLATKQALISEKMNLEIQMDISRYSINSIENKIKSLRQQLGKLVPKDADIQSLDMNIDIASKEYLDILDKYNQSNLESSFTSNISVVQPGVPGLAQPSKKMLLVILSGIITFVFCVLVIFIIYLLDHSVISAKGLADSTQVAVLGSLSLLKSPSVDLHSLWENNTLSKDSIQYKNQLRSIRHEIENLLHDKILLITSLDRHEGKTLLSLSLSFAWKMTNKKVLLIDGNFSNPTISKASTAKFYLEDFLVESQNVNYHSRAGSIDVLCNKGGDISILELATFEQIKSKLDWAKNFYDLIIIETAALDDTNQAKEWLLFSEDTVSVFEAGKVITEKNKRYLSYLKESGYFRGWIFNKAISN